MTGVRLVRCHTSQSGIKETQRRAKQQLRKYKCVGTMISTKIHRNRTSIKWRNWASRSRGRLQTGRTHEGRVTIPQADTRALRKILYRRKRYCRHTRHKVRVRFPTHERTTGRAGQLSTPSIHGIAVRSGRHAFPTSRQFRWGVRCHATPSRGDA